MSHFQSHLAAVAVAAWVVAAWVVAKSSAVESTLMADTQAVGTQVAVTLAEASHLRHLQPAQAVLQVHRTFLATHGLATRHIRTTVPLAIRSSTRLLHGLTLAHSILTHKFLLGGVALLLSGMTDFGTSTSVTSHVTRNAFA